MLSLPLGEVRRVRIQRLCGPFASCTPRLVVGGVCSSAFVKGTAVIQPMQILVLGPEGLGRSALEETLTRLGYVVMAAEARPDGQAPASGDIVMLDMRGEDADWAGLAEGLQGDDRPVMIVSERPRRLMRALSGRAAGTMVMTGSESDAGYRVALSVCQALRRTALLRAHEARREGRVGLAAL